MNDFIRKGEQLIREYLNRNTEYDGDNATIYVVWFAKTAENAKALLSTEYSDGRYYELTYIGSKRLLVLDAYKKENKVVTSDVELYWGPDHELRANQ